jgi:hypothetical protein
MQAYQVAGLDITASTLHAIPTGATSYRCAAVHSPPDILAQPHAIQEKAPSFARRFVVPDSFSD